MVLWFLPPVLYRFTLKSTAWFWGPLILFRGPLIFLGGIPPDARNPGLYRDLMIRSLSGWTSIALALLTILAWSAANLVWTGTIFHPNPLLNMAGFLLEVDWSGQRPWQLLSVTAAVVTLVLVPWASSAGIVHDHAVRDHDPALRARSERMFRWIGRVQRSVLLPLLVLYWLIAGGYTVLYFNSQQCWFDPPVGTHILARWIYADRLPSACAGGVPMDLLRKFPPAIRSL